MAAKSFLSFSLKPGAWMQRDRLAWVWRPMAKRIKAFKMRFAKAQTLRQVDRYRCQVNTDVLMNRLANLNGRIKDISIGGCLFRPATFYLMDRIGEEAVLTLGDFEIHAKVVRTLPIGYALKFDEVLSEELLQAVLEKSAIEPQLFNKSQEDETRATKESAAKADAQKAREAREAEAVEAF